MIEIELNGDAHRLQPGSTLQDLVEALELGAQSVALAVNRWVVPRERWRATVLQPRDTVDVVRAIGGG
ncbi:MAG: sulfur carrier protein ThiS [Massilia sp.]